MSEQSERDREKMAKARAARGKRQRAATPEYRGPNCRQCCRDALDRLAAIDREPPSKPVASPPAGRADSTGSVS